MGLRRLEPLLSSVVKRTLFSPGGQGGSGGPSTRPPVLSGNYSPENGTDLYVAENGTDQYVTES